MQLGHVLVGKGYTESQTTGLAEHLGRSSAVYSVPVASRTRPPDSFSVRWMMA